jgi:alanine-glyoxylate transaminase/serine-glyoxylate transaminase/serine-pyruvate transaminase
MGLQGKSPKTSGRPFLQIPGPTLVPERIVRAMSQPLIDHRGPEFAALLKEVLEGLKRVFQTSEGRIAVFPGSGTAAWEACIVNTLSPGDRVLGCVNGHFSAL